MTGTLHVIPVTGIGEIRPGDDLPAVIAAHAVLEDGDVVVVTQKVVSKSERRLVEVGDDEEAARARIIEEESVRVLRRRDQLVISETRHGFVCANAGVDFSNVDEGWAALLPEDPDRSARRIRDALRAATGRRVGVIVSDTFGRPWRKGVTDVAIGVAGVAAVVDLRGSPDANGRLLQATEVCVADEIAAAADLVMGKASGVPVAVVRGVDGSWLRQGSVAGEVVRPPAEDLFR
ncbi:MAG TPA: coenzyme F420-0:L-glutamate ligase [Acidimicrobiales bacterium]|nr:coenzyme F420-0:L-glutamate ligase [Acidimicrobiales bacterium]